jgi:capsule polysaccharide export protein KpsC/LpsZ
LKKPGRKIEDDTIQGVEFLIHKVVKGNWIVKRQLRRYYNSLTAHLELDAPYIYVALNYQPERTTSPEGGAFVSQFLMVDLLSKSIPSGWRLYVKEHPSQFLPSTAGSRSSRSRTFYDDLAALPNVKLASLSSSPFQLIDRARAVATVTGTVGWESLLRGRPVLCFGYSWYRDCEGVFLTRTAESCKSAIGMIANGYEVRRDAVRLFIQMLDEECVRAYLNSYWAETIGLSREQNAETVARTIQSYVMG